MFQRLPRPFLCAGVAGLAALVMPCLPAAAQSAPRSPDAIRFGIGYVANAPDAIVGGSAYVLLPLAGGIGLYVDAKFDLDNPSDQRGYDADYTAADVEGVIGGEFARREASWWSANLAVLRPVTPALMLYAGGGMARRTQFRLYNVDAEKGVGEGGVAWVEDPREEETRVNLMAGAVMRISSLVSTHFGFETQPRGVTVGASLRLPRW